MSDERFVLDVGGIFYCTTRHTLSQSPKLQPLVEVSKGDDLFIDRDGSSFLFILNYLRTGLMYQEIYDKTHLAFLSSEADFYELDELATKLRSYM